MILLFLYWYPFSITIRALSSDKYPKQYFPRKICLSLYLSVHPTPSRPFRPVPKKVAKQKNLLSKVIRCNSSVTKTLSESNSRINCSAGQGKTELCIHYILIPRFIISVNPKQLCVLSFITPRMYP